MLTLLLSASVVLAVKAPTPALDAFAATWEKIDAYRAAISTHETSDNRSEDRTYALSFERPMKVDLRVTAGPGRGGRVWWTGGDHVTGQQGGFLSVVKLSLPLNDPRVTSLRGDTVDRVPFGWLLDHFLSTPGKLSEAPVAHPTNGPETAVTLDVPDASHDGGYTREVMELSNTTHLPVDVRRYVGATLVKTIHYSDVKVTSPG